MSQTQTRDRTETTVGTTDEIEDLDAATGTVNHEVALTDQNTMQADVPEAGAGVRIRRAFTMKNFLPAGDVNTWIAANVTSKGVGFHKMVGRIYGSVQAWEARETQWKSPRPGEGEKVIKSIALSGNLQAEHGETGEIITMDMVFLPMAFASQIARAMQSNPGAAVEMDIDVGIESTGKAIPYEWTVTSYLSGRAERQLRQMRNSRRIGQAAPGVAARLAAERSPAVLEHDDRMVERLAAGQDTAGLAALNAEGDHPRTRSARR